MAHLSKPNISHNISSVITTIICSPLPLVRKRTLCRPGTGIVYYGWGQPRAQSSAAVERPGHTRVGLWTLRLARVSSARTTV